LALAGEARSLERFVIKKFGKGTVTESWKNNVNMYNIEVWEPGGLWVNSGVSCKKVLGPQTARSILDFPACLLPRTSSMNFGFHVKL
jgi:hypothetical protein